ncbi:MAG: PEP-CTERM sorting domain-containing protein [Verrucomicrobia bacterium]|nr:PEP-CTERM sorting domain-containing protein [Verrucomicrobiota bacterium]
MIGNYYASTPVAAVPEPGTFLAGAAAAFLLGACARRRRTAN